MNRFSEADYGFEPEYGGLSNHLPMTVHALVKLGADRARVLEFRRAYSPRLSKLQPPVVSEPIDVFAHLGQRREFARLLGFFGQEAREHGNAAAVRKWLPVLMSGVAAAAFHPLIMLYYALDADQEAGVAYSLAYFAWSHLPLGSMDAQGDSDLASEPSLITLDAAVSRLGGIGQTRARSGLLYERLVSEAQRAEVQAVLARLKTDPHDELSLLRLVTSTHLHVNDLLSLHMVTAWHAYCRIGQIIEASSAASSLHLTRALLSAYVACDTPNPQDLPEPGHDWDLIVDLARRDVDEHVIKLVWTCRDIHQRWHVDTRALAARAVRL